MLFAPIIRYYLAQEIISCLQWNCCLCLFSVIHYRLSWWIFSIFMLDRRNWSFRDWWSFIIFASRAFTLFLQMFNCNDIALLILLDLFVHNNFCLLNSWKNPFCRFFGGKSRSNVTALSWSIISHLILLSVHIWREHKSWFWSRKLYKAWMRTLMCK